MNRYSKDVIIVENQQLVICNELGGKRVFIDKIQLILGQLGNYKKVLVKGKTILRLKGIKMWGFETPLQADVYQDTVIEVLTSSDDCLPLAFKEWLEEIFDSDDENDQEKDLLKEVGLKEKDLKERDLKEKDLKEKNLKQKDLKQKDLEGKKDQLSDEDN
ncbi:uncharacterized protein LOC124190022 [Daphnia pulex]|uniref:uncharacterized protein LOC124190022 n=2 Tax=Daphnia TaxID=6668 RepID=UPI001EDD29E4|nr:uncharacterized protein LOC124190022 [Daphnia pulex]